jgi:phosphatidate cytidylyltransferase
MLKKRILTSVCGIPVLVAAIWFDNPLPWFTILVAVLGILSAVEFFRLVNISGTRPFTVYGIIVILLFIVFRDTDLLEKIQSVFNSIWIVLFLIICLLLPLLFSQVFKHNKEKTSFSGGLWTITGIIYIGWMLGHLVALRGFEDGRNWVFYALFVTFAYDTAAFFTGRSLGRHKMAPKISPGKTWEGTAGGTTGAVLLSLFFTLSTPFILPINWWQAIILGLLVSFFGQGGDLLESRFKRYIGVKDAGKALPGHGGFLDRIDSVVFTSLVVYYYVVWVVL